MSKSKPGQLVGNTKGEKDYLFHLPHPKRILEYPNPDLFKLLFIDSPGFLKKFADENMDFLELVRESGGIYWVQDYYSRIHQQGVSYQGEFFTDFIYNRHLIAKGLMFRLTDELNELLLDVQPPRKLECYYLRLPSNNCFIEFGGKRDNTLKIWHNQSGEHALEGVYAIESRVPCERLPDVYKEYLGSSSHPTQTIRVIDFCATGSPIGKTSPVDDASLTFRLYIDDEDEDLHEALQRSLDIFFDLPDIAQGSVSESEYIHFYTHYEDSVKDIVNHLIKVLLYCNSKHYRAVHTDRLSSVLRGMERKKSSRKKQKLKNKASKLYDYIEIGPPEEPYEYVNKSIYTVTPHYRHAHFAPRRVGKGRKKLALVYVRDAYVNTDNPEEIKRKDYHVHNDRPPMS